MRRFAALLVIALLAGALPQAALPQAALPQAALPQAVPAQAVPAQSPTDEQPVGMATLAVESLFRSLEADFDCRMRMYGEPQPDSPSDQWFVRYSASGEGCDAAVDALQARGIELGFLFFRKPDLEQLRVLLAAMTRTAQSMFGCRIAINGEPSLVEASGRWLVSYTAIGADCGGAAEELRRQGRELEITFMGRSHRGPLNRLF